MSSAVGCRCAKRQPLALATMKRDTELPESASPPSQPYLLTRLAASSLTAHLDMPAPSC